MNLSDLDKSLPSDAQLRLPLSGQPVLEPQRLAFVESVLHLKNI